MPGGICTIDSNASMPSSVDAIGTPITGRVVLILTGILGTSRILLHCHTLMQVVAGVANGFLWVFILT